MIDVGAPLDGARGCERDRKCPGVGKRRPYEIACPLDGLKASACKLLLHCGRRIDQFDKAPRFEAGATNQSPVDVGLREKFRGIGRLH
jgi:hypothetical protein